MSTAQSPRAQHQLAVLFRKTDVSYPRFPPVSNDGASRKGPFFPTEPRQRNVPRLGWRGRARTRML